MVNEPLFENLFSVVDDLMSLGTSKKNGELERPVPKTPGSKEYFRQSKMPKILSPAPKRDLWDSDEDLDLELVRLPKMLKKIKSP